MKCLSFSIYFGSIVLNWVMNNINICLIVIVQPYKIPFYIFNYVRRILFRNNLQISCLIALNSVSALNLATMTCFLLLQVTRLFSIRV